MAANQSGFEVDCAWGIKGLNRLAPKSDVVVIVDVMSFSTCVEIAASRGAVIYPCRHDNQAARLLAEAVSAELAGPRGQSRYSLSPQSLWDIPRHTRLVLPSPNGATLSLAAESTPTLTGCLRNCQAVAYAARRYGNRLAIIPAGEQGDDARKWRPAVEDLLGAGAIIHYLPGRHSLQAQAAEAAYLRASKELRSTLAACCSGRELAAMGFADDIALIAELNISETVPLMRTNAFTAA